MVSAAVLLLLLAGALRTRLGRLLFARVLLLIGIHVGEAGSRILDEVKREMGR